ncbi:MAG: hypothetical protein ACRDV9_07490 [Acidimicrobiia bacterium]
MTEPNEPGPNPGKGSRETDFFRTEALRDLANPSSAGGVASGPPGMRWGFWLVVALPLAGLLLSSLIRVPNTVSGPALVDLRERAFVALLPAGARLEAGDFSLGATVIRLGESPLSAESVTAEEADTVSVRRAGFASAAGPGVIVSGRLTGAPADLAGWASGQSDVARVVITLRRDRLLKVLLRPFQRAVLSGEEP